MSKFLRGISLPAMIPAGLLIITLGTLANLSIAQAPPPAGGAGGVRLLSGRRAPSFALQDSNMTERDILDYRGHWLLIDFMRTDCPHCKALTKLLEGVKAKVGASKVSILSVVLAPPDNQGTVGKYIAENHVTSPILFDMGQVAIAYFKATPQRNSYDTPHLFAVDPAGNIAWDWSTTAVEQPGFEAELEQILNAKK